MRADVIYLRPSSAEEAVACWAEHQADPAIGNDIRYLAGGTEIVTSARKAEAGPRVLIDVARLPELLQHTATGERWVFGAALTLNQARQGCPFELLSATLRHIADHTTRNRLTLGGNIAGVLPYREAVLPLLLADATVLTLRPGGPGLAPVARERSLRDAYGKRLDLEPGELVVAFAVTAASARGPARHERATRSSGVDYPLVTACFLGGAVAVSGLLSYPAWFPDVAAARAAFAVPGAAKHDQRGSAEYRLALFETMARRAEEENR